jgi:predicted Zn finger-like uncharacterized protein
MINVECDGCKSPYQVDERRVPATGLKMRCSKCGNSILVQKPIADVADQNDLPIPAPPQSKRVAPVFPRGPVVPKSAPVAAKSDAASAEKAALAFARGEGSRFDFPAQSIEDDPLGDLDLPSPATMVSKEKPSASPAFADENLRESNRPTTPKSIEDIGASERTTAEPAKRPSERPTAPHLPAVVVPKADVTQFVRRDVEPAPRGKPTVRRMAAVVVDDLMKGDLPAIAPSRDAIAPPMPQPRLVADLPSVSTNPPLRQTSVADLPSPAKPSAKDNFEIDFSEAGLPPVETAKAFGEIDLPATVPGHVAARGFGVGVLPAPPPPREAARSFGEIDLPAVPAVPAAKSSGTGAKESRSGHADLPIVSEASFGEIDLPGPEISGDDGGFGEFDLPAPEGDASFGQLDLPLPSGKSGEYQAVVPAKLAARPAPIAEPAPSTSGAFSAFGDLELPLTSESSMSLQAVVAPAAMPIGVASPTPALDFALDDLSLDAPASKPKTLGDNSPQAPRAAMTSIPGEEFVLGGQRNSAPPQRAMDMTGGIGDEVELGAGDVNAADGAGKKEKPGKGTRADAASAPPLNRKERLRRRALQMGVAVLIAVGGGSLALMPDIGPFGVYAITDIVQADEQTQSLMQLEKNVQAMLDEDTMAASARALAAAKAAQVNLPRHRATAAYTAYVALLASLRHGPRASDETFGKQMLEFVGDEPSRERALAVAARHKTAGKLDAAKRAAKDLAGPSSKDIDSITLMGEIELATGTKEDALAVWTRAVALREKSARALFGLARAQFAMGDLPNAEKNARVVIEVSPQHAGARILVATIISKVATTEAEAIELLNKVTAPGDVRAATSESQIVQAYIEAGRVHLLRSRITAASEAFAEALKMDPRNVQALLGDAELFFRSGRNSQALLRFEEAMKADDTSVLAKTGTIKTLLALEKKKDAKDLAKKIRDAKPELAIGAFWMGRVEESLGNKKDAETLYLEAIKLGTTDSEIVDAYVSLVALLSAIGRAEDAQAKLAEASAKYPNLAALHRAKGEVLSEAGRYPEARAEFEAALAKEDDLGTRFRLGVTFRRMRLFDEAMGVLDKLQAADKEYPGLALERGLVYAEMGQSERALEMYNAALEKAPNDADLKLRVGSTQVIAGHPDEAEKILREVLKDRAASADANHFLGRALLLKGGSTAEAIRFLDRATEIDANRAEYYVYVGWAANELNQIQRAEQAISRALELDRELADAYWQRAVLYHKQGRTLDALSDLQIALEKRPSRFEAYATMALCYQDQARWPDAEKAWVKAIEGNGSIAEWHYRLGKIYESHGNRGAAAPELEKTVELIEAKPGVSQSWHFDAYFIYGETMQATGQKEKALKGYRRYLQLAPINNAYRVDAERAIKTLDPNAARRP